MYVKQCKENEDTYLSLWQNDSSKSIFKIGKLSELSKAFKDPKKFFNDFLTTIQNFNKKIRDNLPIPESDSPGLVHIGAFYIDYALEELGLSKFLRKIDREHEHIYSLERIVREYISQKILDPTSILGTFKHQDEYVLGYNCSLEDIYNSLDLLDSERDEIQERIYSALLKKSPHRDLKLLAFDCTNYYYESDHFDKDKLDEEGNILEEFLRKRGFSKENKPDPLVGIALVCTPDGMPLFFVVYSGNKSEYSVLPDLLDHFKGIFHLRDFTLVADRGLYSGNVIASIDGPLSDGQKNNYILGFPVKKSSKEFTKWAAKTDYDYLPAYVDGEEIGGLFYKYEVNDKKFNYTLDGKTKSFKAKQGILIYKSDAYARREKYRRDEKIQKIKKALSAGKISQIIRNQNATLIDVRHFTSDSGELATVTEVVLDEEKIKRQEELDGKYAITTNDLLLLPLTLITDYHTLLVDERNFKLLKTDLKLRPAYVRTPSHIRAYILLSIIALDVLRFLEDLLDHKFTIEKIIRDLKNFIAVPFFMGGYLIPRENPVISKLKEITQKGFSNMFISTKQLRRNFKVR